MPEVMYQALLSESQKLGGFHHGFTYSGHPVAAAVAVKTLDIYARDKVFTAAAARMPAFQQKLTALGAHPLVGEARGLGLMGGLELVADKKTKRAFDPKQGVAPRCVRFAEAEGLIVRAVVGDTVTMCPPLIITAEEIDELFARLTRALDRTLGGRGFGMSLSGGNAGAGKIMLLGLEIWRDEINAKGGLLGRHVQFVSYDDQSNPGLVPSICSEAHRCRQGRPRHLSDSAPIRLRPRCRS